MSCSPKWPVLAISSHCSTKPCAKVRNFSAATTCTQGMRWVSLWSKFGCVRFWPGQFGTEYQRAIAINCNSCQGGSCMAWPSSWSNSAKAPRAMMPLAAFFGSPGPSKGSIKSCWKLKCHGFQVWTMDGTKPFSPRAIYTFIDHQLYIH